MAKSNTMYVWLMVTWLLCVAWFIPRFASLWRTLDSSLLQTLLVFVLFCLAIFWFYGIHFYAFFLFTHLERRRKRLSRPPRRKPQPHPQVAILYPTADDFEYRAALSCVNQAYPSFHVFLLDDSSREEYHTRVDAFHHDFPEVTTVIRRENREGFKAGNLNNALAMVGCDHEFFAICDADNILPTDFLTQLTPYLQEDSCLGFVQANHRINGLQKESFVQDFHRLVDVGWDHHHLPRNRYGLAFCFGHGVVLRTEAWKQAGGFPLIVSEDIALTLSMRRQGYFGRHVPEVICGEGIPLTLRTWR
ncbi:MAG: glycosyltransferase, partial [Dehalococcoidia bacterium]